MRSIKGGVTMGVFDKPKSRIEAVLMDIRDSSTLSTGWSPKSRIEAILMQIRDNGGGGGGGPLPVASTTTLGGVKIDGTSIVINDGVISVGYANGDTESF